MKMTVKRSCGHLESINVYGGKYDRQMERERQKACYPCYKGGKRPVSNDYPEDVTSTAGYWKRQAY